MIFDMRVYTCKPGTIQKHMELYEKHGLAPQTRCLGEPVLYGITETGKVNTYVHVWAYESAADREQKRAVMWSDPEWLAYTKMSAEAGYLIEQTNSILTAASFFKLPGS